jgi:PadR family transcriptional regulator, regulatory protein PadR
MSIDKSSPTEKAALLQGTLDMLILQTLRLGPAHGHGIGQAICSRSSNLLTIEAGSLYPALHRLERHGLLVSEWKISENNQRAKFYRLTAAGRKHLLAEASKWDLLVKAVSLIRNPT